MGQCLVLNESGGFIQTLPASTYWQKIDDQGQAIALTARRVAAANSLPAYYAPELKSFSYGFVDTIPIPNQPGVSPNYSLQRFSNDGRILLSRSVKNAQLANTIQYHFFDLNTRALTRVRQPGLGNESIVALSNQNGRLVGTGPKPYQITPDGTCIRLDALRIKNSPAATPVPFGTLYTRSLTPNHISSDGTATVSTTDNSGQTVILQIVPHNDTDGDGLPDDWEKDYAAQLLADGQIESLEPFRKAELLAGNLDSEFDYAANGVNIGSVYAAQHNPQSLAPNPTGMRFEMQQKGIQGVAWEVADRGVKYYSGFYNTHGMNSGGTGGGYYGWFDSAEKIPTIEWTKANTDSQDFNHVVNPLMNFGSIGMPSIESWYKTYQGNNFVNYRVKNEKRQIRIWGSKLVATEDVTVNLIKAVFYQADPHPEWDAFTYEDWFTPLPTSAVLESVEAVKIKIPKGKTCSKWYEYETPLVDKRAYKVFLLPVEVVELSPRISSETNETVAVPDSEIPKILPESNQLVERDPLHQITDASTVRIAWRDLKVKIGREFSGKTITWRMTPRFTPHIELGSPTNIGEMITVPDPNGPRFRGSWEHAENEAHQDAFSASEDYGSSYNWNRRTATTGSTPGEATTNVHDDGYTAIRVNVPPIGFNKARVSIQIEGSSTWIDLIDLEVPAVVVIDPGHGGPDSGNSLETVTPKLYERDLTLSYATEIKNSLRISMQEEERSCKVVVGKQATESGNKYPNEDRAAQARRQGADIDLALHFNGGGATSSGTQVYLIGTSENNLNYSQDKALATRMYSAGEAVFGAGDRAADQRIIDLGAGANGRVFIRDTYLGNVAGAGRESTYIRAVLLELEYLSLAGVANKLTGPNATNTRQSYAREASLAITNDILVQP